MRNLAIAFLVGIVMAVTNPSMGDFQAYVQEQIVRQASHSGAQGILQAANAVKDMTGFDAAKWYTSKLLGSARQDNYIILTVYSARIDGEDHVWLGAFKYFLQLK